MAFNKKVATQLIARLLIYESRNDYYVYWLNKSNLKIKFVLKYFSSHHLKNVLFRN